MPDASRFAASVELVRVLRGGLVESVHRGSVVLFEDDHVLWSVGAARQVVYYRSAAKPLQALVLLTSGAADRFGLDPAELAIAAGSHNAEPAQLAVVRSLLAKADVPVEALGCGGHWSIHTRVARAQCREHVDESVPLPRVWSNCSGKHAGMLAAARAMGAPLEGYLDPTHPVQLEITRLIAAYADVPPAAVVLGVDGCGAPAHAVDLTSMARSMVRLGRPALLPDGALVEAGRRIGEAMTAHPDLVAGTRRFDTDLMQTAGVRVLAKAGAEGVHGLAVPDRGLGLAIKVDDGQDRGYRQVLIELLRRHGVLTDPEADALAERHGRTVKNFAGAEVGRLEVVM